MGGNGLELMVFCVKDVTNPLSERIIYYLNKRIVYAQENKLKLILYILNKFKDFLKFYFKTRVTSKNILILQK